jgi:hypothetical protein
MGIGRGTGSGRESVDIGSEAGERRALIKVVSSVERVARLAWNCDVDWGSIWTRDVCGAT